MLAQASAWAYHRDVPDHGGYWGHDLILCKLYVQPLCLLLFQTLSDVRVAVGIGLHVHSGPKIWRIPFGFQLVPAVIMVLGLLTVCESPRWLASQGRSGEALSNLAYLRKCTPDSEELLQELAEIQAAIAEERKSRASLGLREAAFGRGNFIRFLIAFFIFFLQQWCGQNSINYYAPQIFTSVSTFSIPRRQT
jgi:hypothetical protein